MKSRLLFFVLCCALHCKDSFSQMHAFPTQDAQWCYDVWRDNYRTGSTVFIFNGDTIIGAYQYSKIIELVTSCCTSWNLGNGFIRENNGKVYFIPEGSMGEVVLYDFNLSLGDSFLVTWKWPGRKDSLVIHVTQIDSVLTNVGYRKRIQFNRSIGGWIEGIGNLSHVTQPVYDASLSGGHVFKCFLENGQNIYGLDCSGCTLVGINPKKDEPIVSINPNPVTQNINILLPANHYSLQSISITNLSGKQILQTTQTEIPVSHLAKGLYFVQVEFTNGQRIVKKILVE